MMFKNALIRAILAVTLFCVVFAYPSESRAQEEKRMECPYKRLLGLGQDGNTGPDLGFPLTQVGGLLSGLLGKLANGVQPSQKVPDAAHPYQAPGSTDQRGPCPGLNTLANHGYIPRSGIVTAQEVIDGTAAGFNMGNDLSALLTFIAVGFGGNIATDTFSIGGEDSRTYSASGVGSKAAGRQYGLDGHSRCEGDISATRRDYFTNNGDNHNAYPDRFKRFMQLAQQNGGEFNLAAANQLYGENAKLSIANNPKLFFNSYTIVVILGEYPFIPNFMSNGTYGAGGTANLESIASIYGMSFSENGKICYVPERFPDNWYRRQTPYGVLELVENLGPTYLTGPELVLPSPLNALQNLKAAPQIGCELYQGITSGIPASLLGSANDEVSSIATYLSQKLLGGILPSVYGCSPSQPSLQQNGTGGGQYSYDTSTDTQSYNSICA